MKPEKANDKKVQKTAVVCLRARVTRKCESLRLDTPSRNECFNSVLVALSAVRTRHLGGSGQPQCMDQYVRQRGATGTAVRAQRRVDVEVESGWGQQDESNLDSQGSQFGENVQTNFDFFQLLLSPASLWRQSVVSQWGAEGWWGSNAPLFSTAACSVR